MESALALWVFVFSFIGPYLANQLGWVATEVGRQPWVVYHILRTSQGVSTGVPLSHGWISLILFSVVYTMLFAVWAYVMNTKIHQGPDDEGKELK